MQGIRREGRALNPPANGIDRATPKAILIWEDVMPTLVGFGRFAALLEERISEKISRRILSGDQGMIVWWSIGAGVHVEPHSHANESRSRGCSRAKWSSASAANSGSAAGVTLWSFREVLSTRHGSEKTPR